MTEEPATHGALPPKVAACSPGGALYQSEHDALIAVHERFHYWTGRLTETSLQLSFALIAANWAAFGSVDKILDAPFAKLSISSVVLSLGLSMLGAKWMGELHRRRIEYAEENALRWAEQCRSTAGKTDPWPFTTGIERLGRCLREAKTWLPVLAGVFFFLALLIR